MSTLGRFSLTEITTQGESWQSAIDATAALADALLTLMERNRDRAVVFIGCGSTYCLAQYAAPFFQRITRRQCRGVPSSELLFQTDSVVAPGKSPLVIALSRSGETTETVMAVEKMRARGSDVLTISCYECTPLAGASSLTITIPGGRERSFAQTRSFAGMLVATQVLAAMTASDAALLSAVEKLPALAPGIVERARPLARSFGGDESYERITYLGSGPLYGLASEATIKIKEMALSVAEPYRFMEFRHGPMALVDQEHLVVALLSDKVREYEVGVLREVKQSGGAVLIVANEDNGLGDEFDGLFALGTSLPELARGVLYLPLVQLLAYYRAIARGLNPDRPRNVVMAVRLKGTGMARE